MRALSSPPIQRFWKRRKRIGNKSTLVGTVGFEPTDDWVRANCFIAWRRSCVEQLDGLFVRVFDSPPV